MTIETNLQAVRRRIAASAERAGRKSDDILLLAVSKRHSVDAIREAYAAGQRSFGENYVQEMVAKADSLRELEDLRWHFIGHLQRNKVKDVLRVGAVVETVDSVRIARALSDQAEKLGATVEVFVQASLAGEAQKSGCVPEELAPLVELVRSLPSLELVGLTTIPPFSSDPESSRPYFAELRRWGERLGVPQLSMGMSADLEVAVEEGATLVRIGTAIFGERV